MGAIGLGLTLLALLGGYQAILIYTNHHVSRFDWAISASLQEIIQSVSILAQVVLIVIAADFVLY